MQTNRQASAIRARISIGLCEARAKGMRIAATIDPPRAAVGTFPYPHRTCAQWMAQEDVSPAPVARKRGK